jgi:hypothetical protein
LTDFELSDFCLGSYARTILDAVIEQPNDDIWYLSRTFIMTVSALGGLLPLSLIPSLRVIAYASFLALFAMAYVIVLIPVLYFTSLSRYGK